MKTFLIVLLALNCYALSIVRIKDGDTFKLSDSTTIRLIGIDTPEKFNSKKLTADATKYNIKKESIIYMGNLSTEYAKQFLNKEITITFDKHKTDCYERILGYIYLLNDTISINQHLIENGYAKAYTKYSFKYKSVFIEAQTIAQHSNKGLWKFKAFKTFANN